MKDAVKLHSSGYTDIFLKDGVCQKNVWFTTFSFCRLSQEIL